MRVTGAYTIIEDYMRERRYREMFVPLAHPPGHAQADFGETVVVAGGVEQKGTSSSWTCRTVMPASCAPMEESTMASECLKGKRFAMALRGEA
ncbi:hypothetical protein P279_04495 [Rhodobacteraceae bacterium PD-2]|nr:hypothetical protein P279_04495 [Rhodobacteraceae bacterium PD-2]